VRSQSLLSRWKSKAAPDVLRTGVRKSATVTAG
jgi:hypothetical protein